MSHIEKTGRSARAFVLRSKSCVCRRTRRWLVWAVGCVMCVVDWLIIHQTKGTCLDVITARELTYPRTTQTWPASIPSCPGCALGPACAPVLPWSDDLRIPQHATQRTGRSAEGVWSTLSQDAPWRLTTGCVMLMLMCMIIDPSEQRSV
jgi:hypothetical protein